MDNISGFEKVESVFDYELTNMEYNIINPRNIDKYTYLQSTSDLQRLSDLHLLFMVRRDKENSGRIMELLRKIKFRSEK